MPLPVYNNVATVLADYTAKFNDGTILCNTSGAAITVTLPNAVKVPGRIYNVIKTSADANNMVVTGDSCNVNGGSKTTNTQYDGFACVSDGTNYFVIP